MAVGWLGTYWTVPFLLFAVLACVALLILRTRIALLLLTTFLAPLGFFVVAAHWRAPRYLFMTAVHPKKVRGHIQELLVYLRSTAL